MAVRNFWTIRNGKVAKGQIEFKWESGITTSQRRKSCENLHKALDFHCDLHALDVSTASTTYLGTQLSAFNLKWKGRTVECWYQGSKVYSIAGVMHELYTMSSLDAKRHRSSDLGNLIGFNLEGEEYPMEPKTVFYDYLYLNGLVETYGKELNIGHCNCFTDIQATTDLYACQARAMCEYTLLRDEGCLGFVNNFERFKKWHEEHVEDSYTVTYHDEDIRSIYDGIIKYNGGYEDLRNICKYAGLNVDKREYATYVLRQSDRISIDRSYCVVYSDLLLDDLCAIEELARRYDNIYLIAVNIDDLQSSQYAANDIRSIESAERLFSKWFEKVHVMLYPISVNGNIVDGADCYCLSNASKLVTDLDSGIKFGKIVGMIGSDHYSRVTDKEYNASQDIESYCKLCSYGFKQVTRSECEELFVRNNYYSGDYEYLPEYIKKMKSLNESVCCFDLQAVHQV